ncbi:yap-binding protein [Hirsutella rhossiliensis]|uniref:Yap-binding protein n=1 Tax=Hirsutella rhossiliensis TaxID=111463 RepID=A0A9P8MRE5_9HYPO|nr:yap-binding protein [Hirsutella rhossiliensis]KAH0959099.1 yap-binding protein [Hirsutella rhossiliensis]
MMTSADQAIQRLKESKPPATDRFTYLTIIDKSLSPDILPALQEILEDVELTGDIGWDLVEMLIAVPGSDECLRSIARLGNPREVILKVLQVMDAIAGAEDEGAEADRAFVTLCGMLGILHSRLQVKAPSRFLHTTLETVYRSYDPSSAEATAAVIALVRSMSGQKRPPLPTRQSSTLLETPFQQGDSTSSAPDPEADHSDSPNANEPEAMKRLLQSFITCVIEAYVNSNGLEWASRLLEFTYPERIVPGRITMMQAFKQQDELRARDALVGQLVAAAGDLDLPYGFLPRLDDALQGPIRRDPLSADVDPQKPEEIKLSTGGLLCLLAYCIFAGDVFDADQPRPDMYMFPDHHLLMKKYLGEEDPQAQVTSNPGTIEALVVIAIWLDGQKRISAGSGTGKGADGSGPGFMAYHHLLTLVSVFHPNLRVRNAATVMAGIVLHTDPDEDDRLTILEDLLENCMFSSLQACAVSWLREEMVAAKKAGSKGRFSSPECLESLQYTMFPDLTHLADADGEALLEFWTQSSPLLLQVANFALFLYGGDEYRDLAPAGMAAAIEHRYVDPLLQAAKRLSAMVEKEGVEGVDADAGSLMQLGILTDVLGRVPLQ